MFNSDFFPVRLSEGGVPGYAEGGLASAADAVSEAGRGGDDVIIHINRDELDELVKEWGEPTINPETGYPEFFLKGLRDWFSDNQWANIALPIATGVLAPGLGSAIGSTLGGAVGADLSPAWTGALGNGLLGAGLGALTGGGTGALLGGLSGGLTGYMSSPGDSLPTVAKGGMGPDIPAGFTPPSGSSSSGFSLGDTGAALKAAVPILALAGGLGGLGKGSSKPATSSIEQQEAEARNNEPLSRVRMTKQRRPMPRDLRNYGRSGSKEYAFFSGNALPEEYADGGDVAPAFAEDLSPGGYTSAMTEDGHTGNQAPGDGRADTMPALVSNNEYIFDAESVALLGNGSPDAGAEALDEFRRNLRKHKGRALARGEISPDALAPEQYLSRGDF